MKLVKYLTIALASGLLMTSCGEDYFNDVDSSTISGDQMDSEAKKDPSKILSSQLNGCYIIWNTHYPSRVADTFWEHTETGFGAIMTVSDVMSNDISLALGSSDPYHFDHALDYSRQEYIRSAWFWDFFYTEIKAANDVIDVIDESNQAQRPYLGQALAIRAISYAYLAQLYQKTYIDSKEKPCVPLRLSSKEESDLSRASVEKVYTQVTKDLEKAVTYLQGFKRADKTTIDQHVAEGFLARVYLVMNQWQKAADMAKAAREGYGLNNLTEAKEWNYQDASNKEAMWVFTPSDASKLYYASWASWHSVDGPGYISSYKQLMDQALYNSMPKGDVRRNFFVSHEEAAEDESLTALESRKFPFVSQWMGNVIYMRVSEMYLIEAEAALMAGDKSRCASVMAEFMPNRVENWTAPASYTQRNIYTQRRLELWGEGFGYFDCVRLKQDLNRKYAGSNEPTSTQVQIPAESYKWTFQVPKDEIRDNDAISDADQNPAE